MKDLGHFAKTHLAPQMALPDVIANALREAIFAGVFASSPHLRQEEIAAQFGVSRIPVREAFQKLVAEGLVVYSRNKGVTVSPLSETDFLDIQELRILLEGRALSLSAPLLSESDLHAAETFLQSAVKKDTPTERARLHWEFHRILYSKIDRPRLLAQIESLHVSLQRYLLPVWADIGLAPHWEASHFGITEAIRRNEMEIALTTTVSQIEEATERVVVFLNEKK
jgi:DNA-binding GntR family transcriptional regulator